MQLCLLLSSIVALVSVVVCNLILFQQILIHRLRMLSVLLKDDYLLSHRKWDDVLVFEFARRTDGRQNRTRQEVCPKDERERVPSKARLRTSGSQFLFLSTSTQSLRFLAAMATHHYHHHASSSVCTEPSAPNVVRSENRHQHEAA